MTSRHRDGRFGAAFAGVLAALLFVGSPAIGHAQTVDSDTFVLSGSLVPSAPATLAAETVGTATLTADCVGLSVDSATTDVTVVSNGGAGPCVSATGAFTSLNCLVDTATLTGTISANRFLLAGTDGTPEKYNVSFTVTVVGAVGIIDGTASEPTATAFGPLLGVFAAPTSQTCLGGVTAWGVDGVVTASE